MFNLSLRKLNIANTKCEAYPKSSNFRVKDPLLSVQLSVLVRCEVCCGQAIGEQFNVHFEILSPLKPGPQNEHNAPSTNTGC